MRTAVEPAVASAPGHRLYVPLAVLFSLLWASAFGAVKKGLQAGSPPLFLMGFRFLLAGALLLALAVALRQPLPRAPGEWLRLTALGLLNYGLYLGISGIALGQVSAGLGAVLASTNPLMLALVAPLLLRERLGGVRALGMLVAFVSVVAIMWSRIDKHLDTPLGMGLILLANVFLTAGTIAFKRWQPRQTLTVLNGVQLLVAGVFLLAPSLLFEPVAALRPSLELAAVLAYLVLVVSLGAMSIWFFLLRSGDAARASSFFFLNPVFGLALGALLLGEPLRPLDFAGSAGVALGLRLVQRGG